MSTNQWAVYCSSMSIVKKSKDSPKTMSTGPRWRVHKPKGYPTVSSSPRGWNEQCPRTAWVPHQIANVQKPKNSHMSNSDKSQGNWWAHPHTQGYEMSNVHKCIGNPWTMYRVPEQSYIVGMCVSLRVVLESGEDGGLITHLPLDHLYCPTTNVWTSPGHGLKTYM